MQTSPVDRRRFLRLSLGLGAIALLSKRHAPHDLIASAIAATDATDAPPGSVLVDLFDDANGRLLGNKRLPKLVLTDAQWRQRLSPAAYHVMRQQGTELAFSGSHEKPAQHGLYRCPGCATALFDAAAQFDSGTGWPSFWQPISAHNITQSSDGSLGMDRTAISCSGCDSHLGHVFDDGPAPTGLRYCMNSVALRFVPRRI